jgi:hypothetical protein
MYVILPITLAFIIVTWFLLRHYTRIWIDRPISISESVVAGITSWTFLLSIVAWFAGMILALMNFISYHEFDNIWALLFSGLLTGFGIDFIVHSRTEMRIDETKDFIIDAIQFHRSAQHRLDLLSLMQIRRKQKNQAIAENDPESHHRARLQADLNKERELDFQLKLLREEKQVDISDDWRIHAKQHSPHLLYEKVEEVRIEPKRKRLSIFADFPELDETQLKDEMTVLRFFRQVYDFFQSVNAEPWLKPYMSFFESYYIVCRATKINPEGIKQLYPFMKAGIPISELHRMEDSYFNPRKLSEIAALAFNNGAQV